MWEGFALLLDAGEVVDAAGRPVGRATRATAGPYFFHRPLPDEGVAGPPIPVLYADDDLIVVDKPPLVATMPRGSRVAQTVVVRLRRELGNDDIVAVHRLDRLTSGVLLLSARPGSRAPYQRMFADRAVRKEYLAVSSRSCRTALPTVVENRIVKRRGSLCAEVVPGEPNARSRIEAGPAPDVYRLLPETGRTHQLRLHMAGIGLPIDGDPLYGVAAAGPAGPNPEGDGPMALLAYRISFTDPIAGAEREFVSGRDVREPARAERAGGTMAG